MTLHHPHSHHSYSLDSITIIPAQLYGSPPRDHLRETISTNLSIGGNSVERPLELKTPVVLAGTPETYTQTAPRLALLHGAAGAGTMVDCGWLGMLESERAIAAELGARTMLQLTAARLVGSIPALSGCDAIELSVTHAGSGSMNSQVSSIIAPETLAPELAGELHIEDSGTLFSPSRLLDMDTPRDLNKLVQLIRELTNHELPVLVKIGPGRIYNDIRIAVNAKPDGVILECMQDARFAPALGQACAVHTPTGLPIPGILSPMEQALKASKAKNSGVKLMVMADFNSGADIFKVMAFGASGVVLTTASLQKEGVLKGNPAEDGRIISEFLNRTLDQLTALTAWAGHDNISEITTEDLRALNYNTAAVTGLKLIGYEKSLTMWEH